MADPGPPNDQKKDTRASTRQRGNIRVIAIEEKGSKEQELTIRYKAAPGKKPGSVWSWYEEFAVDWCEILIPIKRRKQPR